MAYIYRRLVTVCSLQKTDPNSIKNAENFYDKMLAIAKQNLHSLQLACQIALARNYLISIYYENQGCGTLKKAIALGKENVHFWEQNAQFLEAAHQKFVALINLGEAWDALARIENNVNVIRNAVEYYEQEKSITTEIQQKTDYSACLLRDLAMSYWALENNEFSPSIQKLLFKALKIKEKLFGLNHLNLAVTLLI